MIIDGRQIAKNLEQDLKQKLEMEPKKSVAFVLFGNDPASLQFIGIKSRVAERIGIQTKTFHFSENTSTEDALNHIKEIVDQDYDGIIIQLPLPTGMDVQTILNSVPLEKDIDILSDDAKKAYNNKNLKSIPPVAAAMWELLKSTNVDLEGKEILIVGNGKLVGEPVSMLLSHENISYTIIDKDTDPFERSRKLSTADIIISGVGVPHMIKPDMVKDGVILIDAGTSEQADELVGDIDPTCADKASYMTPVPGGVGPVAVVCLYKNLLK
jgi:methylenetetrahydrofolate dehydrogenase (NADP+)/methenyltetrahydrofolate cyclohydrolase